MGPVKVEDGYVVWSLPNGSIYDFPVPRSREEAERWHYLMSMKGWVGASDLLDYWDAIAEHLP